MMYNRATALTTWKWKKKKRQNRVFSTILKLTCVFSYTLFFLFGGYERSFIIMKVPPQFLFLGREGRNTDSYFLTLKPKSIFFSCLRILFPVWSWLGAVVHNHDSSSTITGGNGILLFCYYPFNCDQYWTFIIILNWSRNWS